MDVIKRKRVQLFCNDKSLTRQSFKAEVDINSIVAKARTTGLVSHLTVKRPMYGDFASVPMYQNALNIVNFARERFDELPAIVRERFSNDPLRMLVFLSDPKNASEGVSLGLLEPKAKDLPVPRVYDVDKRHKGDADPKDGSK